MQSQKKGSRLFEFFIVVSVVVLMIGLSVAGYVPSADREREQLTLQNGEAIRTWAERFARTHKGLFPHGVHVLGEVPENPFGGELAVKDGKPPYDPEPGICYYEVSPDRRRCTVYVFGRNGRELKQWEL